jgi:acetyltransferase-like isoleucine patch superfamily enzyme
MTVSESPADTVLHHDRWQTVFRRSPRFDSIMAAELRIFLGNPAMQRARMRADAEISGYTNWVHPDLLNTMGFASYHMGGSGEIVAGNYCSIAGGLAVMGERHPIEYATSSAVHYDRHKPHFTALIADFGIDWHKTEPKVPPYGAFPVIEHDVWIGANVTLARGIRIGTGAVIAMGSMVTKDVAPYAIVAGNPARHKRMRFDEGIVEQLFATQWWQYADVIGATDMRKPERFLPSFAEAKEAGRLCPVPSSRVTRDTIMAKLGFDGAA